MTAAKRAAGQGKRASRNARKERTGNAAANARKERLRQRQNALRNACEGLLVARGWRISEAAEFAYWWVREAWQAARRILERAGYSYMDMTWRAT